MRSRVMKIFFGMAVLSGLTLLGPRPLLWSANLSTDYTGVPPYVSSVATPNILLLLDNSLSMQARANCDLDACPPNPDGTVNNTQEYNDVFDPTVRYSGYFDSMRCYTYGLDGSANNNPADANNRFAARGNSKKTLDATCLNDEWDGNLLNWITFRRIDAIKKAMIGGECAALLRNSDGTCQPVGSPAKITIQSHRGPGLVGEWMVLSNPSQISGRIPARYQYAPGLWIHLRSSGVYGGWFCVNDNYDGLYGWYDGNSTCDAGTVVTGTAHEHRDAVPEHINPGYWYSETSCIESSCTTNWYYWPDELIPFQPAVDYDYDTTCTCPGGDPTAAGFNIALVTDTEPRGVIQQVGSQARLGLMVFQSPQSGIDGGLVTVPIGARQSTVNVPRTTNVAAMVDGIDAIFASTATPLAESLYEAARYVAQLPPTYDTSNYSYPYAFGGASAFQGIGVGSLGVSELTALGTGEICPPDYVTNTCGRDPYFFGQNYTPAWASPSALVSCCQTFVIIVTDGAPTVDENIPDALKEYAYNKGVSGKKCTGSDKSNKHKGDGICNGRKDSRYSDLLDEHKTDFPLAGHYLDDVALWAHTTDLRQNKIPVINENGHDLTGMQNLNLYTIYAFGGVNGREILMQASRQGGFVDKPDKNGVKNGLPDVVGVGTNLQECTNPDGSKDVSSPEWDQVNNATGKAGPDCIPDNYFESSNADDIRDRLFATINRILEQNTSGAAAAVLASSSTGEGITYQAFFYQNKEQLTWLGYLQGFFVDQFGNFREDTDGDGKLVLTKDRIIKMRFEGTTAVADLYDSTDSGVASTFKGTYPLSALNPVWEAGRRLALMDAGDSCEGSTTWPKSGNLAASGISCRRILTWVDKDNKGTVDVGERIEFTTANKAGLCPYLGGKNVSSCTDPLGDGPKEATGIINFIRGCEPATCPEQTDLRNRRLSVTDDSKNSVTRVWKLGDIMSSTPVLAGFPRERYDLIYGDGDYARFYQRYKDRRQVVYAGANDGMLHAFNGGFLSAGVATDAERIRFTTTPLRSGTNNPCTQLPCDAAAGVATYNVRTPAPLGAELWAFIPQDLLPQLRWLTEPNYSHAYYVDLRPKVTEARIFCNDDVAIPGCIEGNHEDHPGGWGTILIGGMRFGGSCSNCNQVKGSARTVTGDFDSGGQTTRVFLSSYFVLDITNPEKDPVLLWTFRDQDLGLSTAAPAVVRVQTGTETETWYAVFGTGTTHFDGSSSQTAQVFVVDLKLGPSYMLPLNQTSGAVRGKACSLQSPCLAANIDATTVGVFSTGNIGFMGDAVSLDANLDFRVDVIYMGSVFCRSTTAPPMFSPCNGSAPTWKGTMWRLTTQGQTDLSAWGVASAPTKLLSTFTCNAKTCNVGPIPAAASLSIDDKDNFWVFFGTGRLISSADVSNADVQNFFGVKDCFISNLCGNQNERNNLFDVSSIEICTDPDQSKCNPSKTVSTDGGATFSQGFDKLIQDIQNKDGWVTTFAAPKERSLSIPTLLGGILFFSSFSPGDSVCDFSGDGRLYALYFMSGTAYKSSSLGDATIAGNLVANRYINIEPGMPSQVALHLGAQGDNVSGTSGANCIGRVTTNTQTSTATISQRCATPALRPWSTIISWRDM